MHGQAASTHATSFKPLAMPMGQSLVNKEISVTQEVISSNDSFKPGTTFI